MTKDGVIVITANQFRTQELNRRDAMNRLIALIRDAAVTPKFRRPTRVSKGVKKATSLIASVGIAISKPIAAGCEAMIDLFGYFRQHPVLTEWSKKNDRED